MYYHHPGGNFCFLRFFYANFQEKIFMDSSQSVKQKKSSSSKETKTKEKQLYDRVQDACYKII